MTGQSILPILLVATVALAVAAIVIATWQMERKRVEAIAGIASRLGLDFLPARDPELARRYESLHGLREGDARYAFNVLTGGLGGRGVTAFDFHYETHSTDSKGNSQTQNHHRHVVLLHLERTFPDLVIAPEGLFSKIAQAFGYDDIDFESHEFSRRYCVRSRDRRFAYDFCNPAMIELLLAQAGANLEVANTTLAFVHEGTMIPAQIEPNLAFACAVRDRLPAYLFAA
ncbi:MAG: hypothetical protein PHC88_09430 [Terrimicrobiaceae bacterium]|nr:hypothetical protein [Terrimicrobiaceae bacterium]